jgi:diphthamide biosynthesis protein 3
MALVFHDEVELEDFEWDPEEETYYYPCPCGDRFAVTKEELLAGEEVATCPSCSLIIKVSEKCDLIFFIFFHLSFKEISFLQFELFSKDRIKVKVAKHEYIENNPPKLLSQDW